MAVRISQLIAVISGMKAQTDAALAKLASVGHNEDFMTGMEKTSRLAAETADKSRRPTPPQVKAVRYTAAQVLADTERVLSRQWDLALTLDTAQAGAVADVTVGGERLLKAVPVRHLLYLEGEVARLTGLVAGLPVQDGTQTWTTENAPPGQYRSQPQEGTRTAKVPWILVRSKADEHHAQRDEVMTRDEVTEFTTTVNYSGALPAERKALLLDRLSELAVAVKMAREEANSAQVADQHEGQKVFAWLARP